MTKPSLYACGRRLLHLGAAVAFGGTAALLPGTASAGIGESPALAGSQASPGQGAPCGACVVVVIDAGQALVLPESLAGLDVLVRVAPGVERSALEALDEVARRGGRGGLLVTGVPGEPLASDAVRSARVIVIDIGPDAPTEATAFKLKQRITEARGLTNDLLSVGVMGPSPAVAALIREDLGPYLDFVVWAGEPLVEVAGKPIWRTGGAIADVRDVLAVDSSGLADKWVWSAPAAVDVAVRTLADLARAVRLLPPGLIPSPSVRVTCGGAPAQAYLNPGTLETVAIARDCAGGAAIAADPPEPGIERVDLSNGDALVRVPAPGASGRFAEGVQVVGARTLSVEEIIARHQASAARQAAVIEELISTGTLTLSFEAPGFPAPITISADSVIFSARGRTDLEQRAVRINGIAFRGGGVPRLPIIEPERVASPPLRITLTSVYRYRLDGEDTLGGTRCYVVRFEPVNARAPLFRGRAWIAADDFGMVKVAAVQTGLRGPIVASEQIDEFEKQAGGLWLLARSDTRQTYEGAAHRTPIHRVLALARHEVNPADFTQRREAAYASRSVMLRDTPEGYRYLRREPPKEGEPAGRAEPVVGARATRVRTLAAGVIVDPNISIPLPFAGLSYVDFDLLGTGAQVNAFFGGTYGQLAFSVPSLGGSRWQLAGRAFGIAVPYNDRVFAQGREIYEEDIRQRPAHVSAWLLRPLTPRVSVRIGYDLDYTRLTPGDQTAATFVVPANQVVHGARIAIDLQRDGWNASLWWNPARRSGWRAWGRADSGEYDAGDRDFQRYGVSVARSAVLTPRLVARLEGAVMGGRDLDRFSRYSFGTFDNRLRGYPSALIRYDRGGVIRGALAWATGKLVRVDAFADTAMVRDPGFGRALRNYTGVGAALEAPAPFGTLLTVEWGYGFRGVNADGRIGTQVIRVTGFKVF